MPFLARVYKAQTVQTAGGVSCCVLMAVHPSQHSGGLTLEQQIAQAVAA